jgi:hypothetical protein
MAVNFNNFSDGGTTISDNSYMVGFANTNTGGERKWSWGNFKNLIRGVSAPNGSNIPVQMLQTVVNQKSTRLGSTDNNAWEDTPLTRAMTVRTTNPNIRIQSMISCSSNNGNHGPFFRISRTIGNTSTVVGVGTVLQNNQTAMTTSSPVGIGPAYSVQNLYIDFIDNNVTINKGSSLTYTIQWWAWATSVRVYLNRGYADANAAYQGLATSTLTLTELAGTF